MTDLDWSQTLKSLLGDPADVNIILYFEQMVPCKRILQQNMKLLKMTISMHSIRSISLHGVTDLWEHVMIYIMPCLSKHVMIKLHIPQVFFRDPCSTPAFEFAATTLMQHFNRVALYNMSSEPFLESRNQVLLAMPTPNVMQRIATPDPIILKIHNMQFPVASARNVALYIEHGNLVLPARGTCVTSIISVLHMIHEISEPDDNALSIVFNALKKCTRFEVSYTLDNWIKHILQHSRKLTNFVRKITVKKVNEAIPIQPYARSVFAMRLIEIKRNTLAS